MKNQESKKISLTSEEIKEIIRQYRIMRKLIETAPKRKLLVPEEKEWHLQREAFLKNHPPVKKIFSDLIISEENKV
ncbi:MAG: hypothetical protein NZ853_03730 [Leptospiraceae bacterium]|nr:hypothetical protein [Leptospiraceae bacterium]MDW7975285.1 hypothetical protein [Leptospiraceae bacterium]